MSRSQEIAAHLAASRLRIAQACDKAGRDPSEVTLIAVTKTFPVTDIEILADLGVEDVGENKDQEGSRKAVELAHLPLRWHFIGQLQRNKAKKVSQWASVIHSVDREELIPLLGDRDVLLQINLDSSAVGRGGVEPEDLFSLAAKVVASPLKLRGLMAVAPLGQEPGAAFERLSAYRDGLLRRYPEATWLSAGMSGDLEAAIAHGATHVRLGTSILGSRPLVQ